MRLALTLTATLALAGCGVSGTAAPSAGYALQPNASPARAVTACTARATLAEGRATRQFPANCPAADPTLSNTYSLGREIARLTEELREVEYLMASNDGRYYGSSGLLVVRQSELRRALRGLEADAARI